VRYGDEVAVKDLDLELMEGEILTLVGPTGCGKTTTLRVAAGLDRPDSGEVRIDGRTVAGERFVPPDERNVGLVFQDFALFPHLTVEENVGFRVDDDRPVHRWLRLLDIEEQRGKMPETLSGGQKQRVALARSLAHNPATVLLDEPLSNLDATLKENLKWEIRSALKEAGVAAVWVTHDQREALSIGDRMGVMRDGELEQVGEPEECFQSPANRFVAEFLGEASFLPGTAESRSVETVLGSLQANPEKGTGQKVDVMVRPNDLDLRRDEDGNGEVAWRRYEGGALLYGVDLGDGNRVDVRTNHETEMDVGDRVQVEVSASHRLTCFPQSEESKKVARGEQTSDPPRPVS